MLTNTVTSVTSVVRALIKDLEKTDGRQAFEYIGDSVFSVDEAFVNSSSIRVYRNHVELDEDDWSFNADKNQVTIDLQGSGEPLLSGDIIIITYSYYKKWSDIEIYQYINSALSYFVQYRYKKTFQINEEDEIIAINDFNPTTNELMFIALIASILIDPQNTTVSTPEFNLGRNRTDSDQAQISKAFMVFQHWTGDISFNKLDLDC
jgi:hypothetical protein